jgi:hypothetical protein
MKISGIYEYSSDLVQKYKAELAEIVKIHLAPVDTSVNVSSITTNENSNKMIKPIEEINFDDVPVMKAEEETKTKEPEFKEATKFMNFAENVSVKTVGNGTSSKRNNNKIQKVDFDFNFDNFNDVNFSSFNSLNNENKNTTTNEETNKKKNKKKVEEEEEDYSDYKKPKVSKEEINKKFANKKAISSEDYANLQDDNPQSNSTKSKLNSMKFSQAISSSDLYGEPEDDGKFNKNNFHIFR